MPRNRYQHRPAYLRLANVLGQVPGFRNQVSMDPENLVAAARRKTGLTDFGDMRWQTGFDKLCGSLEDEAKLNLVGRLSARSHLLQLLCNRLGIHAGRDQRAAARPVTAPVIITGLPRSGSTLLHGLLAQDPTIRVPWTWEVMLPCALPGQARNDVQIRIDRTDKMLQWVDRLAPGFRAIHPTGAELPQECIAITAHEFASVEFHTTFNVPSYQHWLDRQDGLAAIRFHRQFLQHLAPRGDRRWFLKAPAHLCTLPALAETYPDAHFVFTQRAPELVAASIASHGVILRSAFSDEVDVAAVADYWMHWWAQAWRQAQQFRTDNAVTDLDYEDLIEDPIGMVRKLYSGLDMSLTDDAQRRMRAFLAANPQDKFGRHRYTLGEFGLDNASVRTAFGV